MGKKSKKTYSRSNLKKMACTGCGRHARLVDDGVTARFCNNCFTITGNYLRHIKGMETIKPLANIHVKDKVIGVDGKTYIITGREDVSGEDKFYYVKEEGKKEIIVLGDFFFVSKVD